MKNKCLVLPMVTLVFLACLCVGWAQSLDIKPGSSINPLNVHSNGKVVVAVLGGEDFDVTMIDPSTLSLEGLFPNFGPPGPALRVEDVSGPGLAGDAEDECPNFSEPDGYQDLVMRFDIQDVLALLDLTAHEAGNVYVLELTGELLDGTPFSATDCVMPIKVISTSSQTGGNGNAGAGGGNSSGGPKGPH